MARITQPHPTTNHLLSTRDVCRALSCGRSTLQRLVASGRFPQPIRITGATGRPRWLSVQVDAYLAAMASTSEVVAS